MTTNYRHPQRILILICVVFILLFILFWYAVAPIVTRLFLPHDTYWGITYYTDGTYLNFDDSSYFQNMLKEHHVEEKGKIIDFYYRDNHIEDNPIHGRACDVFVLEIQMGEGIYLAEKQLIENISVFHQQINDYALYSLPLNNETFVKVVAFCDATTSVRYILITDNENTSAPSHLLPRATHLSW